MEKNMIVEGALTGVLKYLWTLKLAYWKQKFSKKAVPLKLCVTIINNLTSAKKSKGPNANLIAAIQMAAIAVQCL